MSTTVRTQTIIRLRPDLLERAKRRAKQQNKSLNSYMESLIERDAELQFPSLAPDFEVSEEIRSLGGCIGMPSTKDVVSDPRLSHILSYLSDNED